jgi:pectinesterase
MKEKFFFVVVIAFCFLKGSSQSTVGITGKRDTSYSTYSAYVNTKKTHPDIKIVPVSRSPRIREEMGIVYCTAGNRNLYMDAFYPKTNQLPKAAILIIHGGGWRSGDRSQHHPLAQRLAALGYVCFTPEYRLSTEALYPAAVYDLKSALRWMRANAKAYKIDTNRIAVVGFSAGGQLAALIGTTNGNPKFEGNRCNLETPGLVRAVVDIDGTLSFVHPESGEGDDSRSISAATYWFGYAKKEKPELWKEASPLTHAGKNTPPTLFINSSVSRMHAGREDYIEALSKHNIYSEVHTFPNSPHSFVLFDPWFEPTVKYISEFLGKVFNR